MSFLGALGASLLIFFGSVWSGTLSFLHPQSKTTSTETPAMYLQENSTDSFLDNGTEVSADPKTFVVLQKSDSGCSSYAKDKNYVYLSSEVIQGAQSASFALIKDDSGTCTVYSKDQSSAYFLFNKIPTAEPSSFLVMKSFYAKDQHHAYYRNRVVDGADVASFVPVTDPQGVALLFSKDKYHVYVSSPQSAQTDIIPDADSPTFVLLEYLLIPCKNAQGCEFSAVIAYAKDKNHVYDMYGRKIEGADSSSFVVVSGQTGYDAQDKNHKYLQGEIVSAAIPVTSTSVDTSFYKNDWLGWKWYSLNTYFRGDSQKASGDFYGDYYNQYRNIDGVVYYLPGDAVEMTKMDTADLASFEFAYVDGPPDYPNNPGKWGVGLKYGRDNHAAYWHGSALTGSDPNTFTLIFDAHNNLTLFSKDKNYVWYENKKVVGADPATFQVVADDYARPYNATKEALDKNHRYSGADILQ